MEIDSYWGFFSTFFFLEDVLVLDIDLVLT